MKILFIIDKMKNYAGIERILTCKMNYIASQTPYDIFFATYEQQSQPFPFQLNPRIIHKPLDIMMPQRNEMTLIKWIFAYHDARNRFKQQFESFN